MGNKLAGRPVNGDAIVTALKWEGSRRCVNGWRCQWASAILVGLHSVVSREVAPRSQSFGDGDAGSPFECVKSRADGRRGVPRVFIAVSYISTVNSCEAIRISGE